MEELFTIARTDDTDLAFVGEILAKVDSKRSPEQTVWDEITIYLTDSNKYVIHICEVTSLWQPISVAKVVRRPENVVKALRDDDNKLGELERRALNMAGEVDPLIRTAAVERI